MKRLYFGFLLLFFAACATHLRYYWNVRELVLTPVPVVELAAPENRVLISIDKRTLQKLFLSHVRITRAANIQTELVLVDGGIPFLSSHPNGQERIENLKHVIAAKEHQSATGSAPLD